MKRLAPLALLILLIAAPARADLVTATFGGLAPGDTTGFTDAGFTFSNHYTAAYDSFTGFAVSNQVDNVPVDSPLTSDDYGHQFGAYAPAAPGTGANGSSTYGIAYNYSVGDALITLPDGQPPVSIDVANTTYAASFLLFGDHFGAPMAQGQYFRLDIIGLDAQGNPIAAAPVVVTLADDPDGTANVIYGFTHVDLTSLQGARSLGFNIDTNVVDSSGFPTVPFTFAVDDVVAGTAAVPEPSGLLLMVAGALGLGLKSRRKRAA